MQAHETYHIEALHLVARDIDLLMEFVVEIQELRRIILDIELLELNVSVELLDIFFSSYVACFLKKSALNSDTKESGFLDELIINERYAATLLGKDVYDLGF